MAVVFVAGGTGYIGRRAIPRLIARGHRIVAVARPSSIARVPAGCEIVIGDPLVRESFATAVTKADTFLQLVGVPHPSPSKAQQFLDIDLCSATASIGAAAAARIDHFVYVSVAQPAPVMKAYQAARAEAERRLRESGLRYTVLRPWYVLGPGHRWPYALLPLYWCLERIPSTRDGARRLGLVTLDQMVDAIVAAVEQRPPSSRVVDVPGIRQTRTSTALAD